MAASLRSCTEKNCDLKEESAITLGMLAYLAYADSLETEELGPWDALDADHKVAWEYAAESVREMVLEKRVPPPRFS